MIIDFLGKVHASDNLVPITPEQASEIENEQLWGSDFGEDDSHLIGGYYDR